MDRRRKVELFEELRQEYRFGAGTIRGVAAKFNVHRRMVRQAIASAIPPERKIPVRAQPKLDPVKEFIDEVLRADQQAPRKQRHTAGGPFKPGFGLSGAVPQLDKVFRAGGAPFRVKYDS